MALQLGSKIDIFRLELWPWYPSPRVTFRPPPGGGKTRWDWHSMHMGSSMVYLSPSTAFAIAISEYGDAIIERLYDET
jgi:hypothetical protein